MRGSRWSWRLDGGMPLMEAERLRAADEDRERLARLLGSERSGRRAA